jgi:hypothetical protein
LKFDARMDRAEANNGLQAVVVLPSTRCGVDSWGTTERICFVNYVRDGVFRTTGYWEHERSEPSPFISKVRAATRRMRLYEAGVFFGEEDKRNLEKILFLGLRQWDEQLVAHGFTLGMIGEVVELWNRALDGHRKDRQFETDRAYGNHLSRLEGYGCFTSDGDSLYAGLSPRERSGLYRIECGIAHDLTGGELETLLQKVTANREAAADEDKACETDPVDHSEDATLLGLLAEIGSAK